jgi:DNA-binding XRE family transcriptional regulator
MTPVGRICAACRRTRLSRYNRQQVCAPCARAARDTPEPGPVTPPWPTWLWGSAPMREVLARCDLGAAVAMFRVAAELSQRELGDLAGWSQGTVSLVETGRRDTLYDIRELLRFADAVTMPREALLPVLLGRPAVLVSADLAPGDGPAGGEGGTS